MKADEAERKLCRPNDKIREQKGVKYFCEVVLNVRRGLGRIMPECVIIARLVSQIAGNDGRYVSSTAGASA